MDQEVEPLESLVAILKVLGPPLGVLRDVERHEGEGEATRLMVEDLADCVALKELSPRAPTGHFLRGFIEGFMRSLGEPVEVFETECINLGHPSCEFELRQIGRASCRERV